MICVMYGKEIMEKDQDTGRYFHGESLGEYWCEQGGLEEG